MNFYAPDYFTHFMTSSGFAGDVFLSLVDHGTKMGGIYSMLQVY